MTGRRVVARYLASELNGPDRDTAVRRAAAWLAQGRRRQAAYLVRDVAVELTRHGYLAASVTTARPLDAHGQADVVAYLRQATGAREVELATGVEPDLVAGVRIETPTAVADQSVTTRLNRLHRLQGDSHA